MNKQVSIWWFPVIIILMGIFNQKCTNDKLKPLLEKEKTYLKQLDSLKTHREQYALKYQDSLQHLRETYQNNIIESHKKIRTLQLKKKQYEKAITEYNNSTIDDKFELLSNLIKKDSL